jgi:hypothetical protein
MGKKILLPVLLLLVSSALSLAAGELVYRIYLFGVSEKAFTFWTGVRTQNLIRNAYPVELNQRLGWIPSPKYNGTQNIFNSRLTVSSDHTRSNGDSGPLRDDCTIVAVGDSFTFGDEVSDHETWPAYLERDLRCRVINGGACAYGIDQSYLRALELIEEHRPRTLLLSLIYEDIERAGHDIRQGLPKPYFSYAGGKLVLHEISDRVFEEARKHTTADLSLGRRILKASYLVTHLIDRYEPKYWLGLRNHSADNHPVAVACQLMQDLERRATAAGVEFYVVAQYYDEEVLHSNSRMPEFLSCLENTPVKVIDTFAALKTRESDLYRYFFGSLTHMTGAGNKLIADTIAQRLRPRG